MKQLNGWSGIGRVAITRYFVWFADGNHTWHFSVTEALRGDDEQNFVRKNSGPVIVLDQYQLGRILREQAGKPLVSLNQVEEDGSESMGKVPQLGAKWIIKMAHKSIRQFCERYDLSRYAVNILIAQGNLAYFLVGKRKYIPEGAWEEYLERKMLLPCQDATTDQGYGFSKNVSVTTLSGQKANAAASAALARRTATKLR